MEREKVDVVAGDDTKKLASTHGEAWCGKT